MNYLGHACIRSFLRYELPCISQLLNRSFLWMCQGNTKNEINERLINAYSMTKLKVLYLMYYIFCLMYSNHKGSLRTLAICRTGPE